MTPKPPPSVVPAPPNFAVPEWNFPNAIPGKQPVASGFLLLPEVTPQGFPVTPPIPPTVQTGDVITAAHENTVSTAINDLWIDLQSLGATTITDPTQAQGDLIVRTATALSRLVVGANGTLLTADNTKAEGMQWATLASTGAVPSSRQVLAGLGMTGGGPLTSDVTLNAKVTSVNGHIGDVALAAADISGAVPSTLTILPADGTLIGGGDLSANRTFRVAPDTSVQRIRYSKDGALVGTRPEVNIIPGSNVTIGVTDDSANNRINVNIAAAGGGSGGMVDPTVNPGDLIVRGTSTTTNLPVGTTGQVLTVDTTLGLKMKWAAQTVGVPATRRINTTGPALTGGGDLTADLTLAVAADSMVQQTRTSYNGTLVGTRRETNFIPGSNVTLTVMDDAPNNRVNVTIASTAVGGAQTPWTSDEDAAGFMLFNASKVGIGTASPQTPLHVMSASVTAATIETTAASGGLALLNLKTPTSFWQVAAGGAGSAIPGSWYVYSQTAAITPLQISPSGNVGVNTGTTTPAASLFQVGQGNPLAAGIADFYGANRTLVQGTALVNILTTDAAAADKGGTLGLGGVSGSPNAYAFAILAGRSENSGYAGYLQFCTTGVGGVVAERMRVTSAGNVGIGVTNPPELLTLASAGSIALDGFITRCGIFFRGGFSPHGGNNAPADLQNMSIRTRSGPGFPSYFGGLEFNAHDGLFFTTNAGTDRMAISPAGNVGIGNDGTGLAFSGYPQVLVGPSTASSACGMIMGCGNASSSGGSVASFSGVNYAIPGTDKRIAEMRIDTDGGIDSGALDFGTYFAGTRSTRMRITSAGNVGIGTSNPGGALEVNVFQKWAIFGSNAGGVLPPSQGGIFAGWNYSNGLAEACLFFNGGGHGLAIADTTSQVYRERIRIDSAGNVGIGTAGPTARLHSSNNGWTPGTAGLAGIAVMVEGSYGGGIGLKDSNNTLAIWSQGGIFYFGTGSTSAGMTRQMVIAPGGKVGIGMDPPSYALDASGDVNCSGVFRVNGVPIATGGGGVNIQINSGGAQGPFTYLNFYALSGIQISNGGVGGPGNNTMTIQIGQASDARLKRDVQPLNGGLAQIMQLRPITGEWNGLANTRKGQRLVSVLAQDLQAVIPEAVEPYKTRLQPEDAEDTELLGVDHMALTCHLILAIQQLERRLKAVEARVN